MEVSLENKLATIMNYQYELRADRQFKREDVMRSMLDDPQIADWLDKMKQAGRISNSFAGNPPVRKG